MDTRSSERDKGVSADLAAAELALFAVRAALSTHGAAPRVFSLNGSGPRLDPLQAAWGMVRCPKPLALCAKRGHRYIRLQMFTLDEDRAQNRTTRWPSFHSGLQPSERTERVETASWLVVAPELGEQRRVAPMTVSAMEMDYRFGIALSVAADVPGSLWAARQPAAENLSSDVTWILRISPMLRLDPASPVDLRLRQQRQRFVPEFGA